MIFYYWIVAMLGWQRQYKCSTAPESTGKCLKPTRARSPKLLFLNFLLVVRKSGSRGLELSREKVAHLVRSSTISCLAPSIFGPAA